MVSGRQLAPRPLMARCLAVPQSNTVADHACAPSHREIIVHAKAYSVSSPTTKPLASLLRTLPPECQDLCTADRPLSTLQRSFPSARRRPAHAPYRTLGSSTRLRAELRHSKVRCERAGTVNDPEVGNRLRRDIDRVGVELVSFGANTAEQPQQISITGKLGTPGNDPGDLPLPASSGACVGSPCPPPAAAARRGCAFKFGEVRRGVDDRGMGEGLREIP